MQAENAERPPLAPQADGMAVQEKIIDGVSLHSLPAGGKPAPPYIHALRLAKQGLHMFPLRPGSKEPFSKADMSGQGWPEYAAASELEIMRWHERFPGCNWGIACGPSGLAVIDVDCKPGKPNGFETLAALEREHGPLRSGAVVRTPSGGEHRYFYGQVASRAHALGPGVDVKSAGGYVLTPGSVIDGKAYRCVTDDVTPVDLPPWVARLVKKPVERDPERDAPPPAELDLPHNVASYTRWLVDHAPEAVEGQGGDAATFHVAAEGRDHGLSAATTLECLAESWNNAKASPPWGLDDLERKVRNAFQYAQGRAGSRTPEAMFPDPVPGGADPPPARRGLRLLHGWEALPTGEASWLADGLIPADGTTLLFGESGAGKSFVALDLAHCIASGQPFHGHSVQQGSVVYVVGEGLHGLWARSRAWCRVHSVTEKLPLFFADAPVAMNAAAQVAELRTAIQGVEAEHGPVVALFVDTLSQNFGGGDENDATSVQAFLRGADEAMQFRRARIIIHHTGHRDRDRARGSSALHAALDASFLVRRIAADSAGGFAGLTLACKKMRDGPPPATLAFQARPVDLGDGTGSLVLELADPEKIHPGDRLSQNQQRALDAIGSELAREGGPLEVEAVVGRLVADGIYTRTSAGHRAVERLAALRHITIDGGCISPVADGDE